MKPECDPAVLLDALTEELLGAFDHEVRGVFGAVSEDSHEAAEAVRHRVAAADVGAAPVRVFRQADYGPP